ncbi:MAG TPA: DPP IV N-terminal domain-containing protein [Candidatus Acidoferrales bacterium]|nr:DPP IV N-terminal domain-containing protein [Candidatus Acidoferrales bacterium]
MKQAFRLSTLVRLFAIAVLISFAPPLLHAQGTAADYQRSQQLRSKLQNLTVNIPGPATWIEGTESFWYTKSVKGGHEVELVDADAATKRPAFDHERLAASLSSAAGQHYTALTLPFTARPAFRGGGRGRFGGGQNTELRFTDQGHAITFGANGFMWRCDLNSYECSKGAAIQEPAGFPGARRPPADESLDPNPTDPGSPDADTPETNPDFFDPPAMVDNDPQDGLENLMPQQGQFGGRGGRGAQAATEKTSPDGQWEAVIENFNVFLRKKGQTEATPLSYDGSEGNYYTLRSLAWSPDSKQIVAYSTTPGYKREIYYTESSPADQVQPKHSTLVYAKAGDVLDVAHPALFDVTTKKEICIDNSLFPNAFDLTPPVWWKDGRGFTFEYNQRGHQVYRVIEVDAKTGKARTLINEESKTFIDYRPLTEGLTDTGKKFRDDLNDGKEIIWGSERDGWEHLYLYDGLTGQVKNQITKGPYIVRYVDYVDEAHRQIWFEAAGMNKDQDPYFTQYYRINFDGSGLTKLTDANGYHNVVFSPDHKYYVDTWSTVDQPPTSQLRRSSDQKVVMDLEHGDDAALVAAGWKAPEVFVAKGRDGKTDIWGVINKPTNFDPSKKYPVVEYIYAGPQGSFVPKTFSGAANPLAELGFIVVQIDGMGTNNRGRAFHDVAWKNLKDAGFEDRILWHKAAAAKYSWYDISHGVGIYGTSAGGQNALGGLLFHPEFYTVGVANSGCHDNRMDKIWWNEQWMGWPVGPQYSESSNVDNAYRLQGKLLLVYGEMDNNVDPSSTPQVVNQLIKHNKKFSLLMVPGGGHGAGGQFYQHLLEDFFVHNLMGVEPPVWNRTEGESETTTAAPIPAPGTAVASAAR